MPHTLFFRRTNGAAACLGCAVVLQGGCAPVASFRPPSALDDESRYELGGGVAALGPRPYVEESTYASGQLWGSVEAKRWLTLSAIAAFDDSAAAGGIAALIKPIRTPRFVAGVEGEVGYAWAAFSVPASLRLFDRSWLYTAPRLSTWTDDPGFGLPVGASIGLGPRFALRAEAQISWADFAYYNRRLHAGAAAAYHW